MNKIIKQKNIFLFVIWVISFFVFFITVVGRIEFASINSDLAYYIVAGQDIFNGNINMSGWYGATNSFYILNIIYGIVGKIFGYRLNLVYIVASALFATMVSFISNMVLSIHRDLEIKEQWLKLFITITLIFSSFYFNTTPNIYGGAHFDCAIIAILAFYIIGMEFNQKKFSIKKIIVLYSFLFVMACSDFLIIYLAFIPMLLVLGVNLLLDKYDNIQKRFLLVHIGIIIFITIASRIFLKVVGNTGGIIIPEVSSNITITLKQMWEQLSYCGELLLTAFGANIVDLSIGQIGIKSFVSFILLFVLLFFLIFDIKNLIKDIFVQFLVMSILTFMGILIFTNYMPAEQREYSLRIAYVAVFSLILLFSMINFQRVLQKLQLDKKAIKTGVITLCCVSLICSSKEISLHPQTESEYDRIVNILEEKNLQKGYASHWLSHMITVTSEFAIEVSAIRGPYPTRFKWLDKDTSEWDYANFIILSQQHDNFDLTEDNVIKAIGKPKEIIDNGETKIYIWNKNIIPYIRGIQSNQNVWNASTLSFSESATVKDGNVVLPKDTALFGPYTTLETGEYQIKFSGKNLSVARADIHSESYEKKYGKKLKYELVSQSKDEIILKCALPVTITDIETRIFNDTNELIVCKDVSVDKILEMD